MIKKKLIVASLIILSLIVTLTISQRQRFYLFSIVVPKEVEALPGEEVVIQGKLFNNGLFWLRNFKIWLEVPEGFEYEVNPSFFKAVRILRAWNPEVGLHRLPHNFTIKIKIPEDAVGEYEIKVFGQEQRSWRKVTNSTSFIIKVPGIPKINVTSIELPEKIIAGKEFTLNATLQNKGRGAAKINITLLLPEDWSVEEKTKIIALGANESETISFKILPTESKGRVSLIVEYEFVKEVLRFVALGPQIVPEKEVVIEIPQLPRIITKRAIEIIKQVHPVVWAVGIIMAIIIGYNLWKIYRISKSRRYPERFKRQLL